MGGRHRSSSKGTRRAGWFVAGACAVVVALGVSLTGVVVGRRPPPGPGTDPEAGVSLRTYPVPRSTASHSDVAGNLRRADTTPPTRSRPTQTRPAVTQAPRPWPKKPERTHPPRPRPTRVCYVIRYRGHTHRYCGTHPPHP